jgi:hypothetical protein
MANNWIIVLQLISVIVALGAWATFRRAGAWRKSDEWKGFETTLSKLDELMKSDDPGYTIKSDVHRIKNELMKLEGRMAAADRTTEQVAIIRDRVTQIEATLEHLPTRKDFGELQADVAGIERLSRSTEAGVTRIESFLMERAG